MKRARVQILRRLTTGSTILTTRTAARMTAWVRAGRRDDLTGTAAALGCWLRILLLTGAAFGAYQLARHARWLMVLAVAVWAYAAWRAAPAEQPSVEAPEDTPDEPESDPRDAVLRLLYAALGDRPAMYLSDVLQHLQDQGHGTGWKVADLRARLEALGIPVEMRLKTGGRNASRGIVRAQLPPLPDHQVEALSPTASTAA